MIRRLTVVFLVLALAALAAVAQADVQHESITEYRFSGTAGKIAKLFGLNKPIHTVEYYQSDIKRTDMLDKKGRVETSEIIDLADEMFISINHKKKQYTRMSFDQWREQLAELTGDMEDEELGPEEDMEDVESEREFSYTLDVKVADEAEEVNGRQAKKMTITIEVFSKPTGSQEDSVKEMTIVSDNWLSAEMEGSEEIEQFNMKLLEKLSVDPAAVQMNSIYAGIAQSLPELAGAMEEVDEQGEEFDGIPIKSVTVFESVKGPEDEQEEESGGGMFGGLKKKAAAKVLGGGSSSSKVLEVHSDIRVHSTEPLAEGTFAIPSGYKLKN